MPACRFQKTSSQCFGKSILITACIWTTTNTCPIRRTIMRMPEQSRTAWWVKRCLQAGHSGPENNSVCTTGGGMTDISPEWMMPVSTFVSRRW